MQIITLLYFYSLLYKMDINIVCLLLLLSIAIETIFQVKNWSNQDLKNDELKDFFEKWKKQYQIQFSQEEDNYRFQIFIDNFHKIQQHNSIRDRTYDLGLNQFSHYTQNQFAQIYLQKKQFLNFNMRHNDFDKSFINVNNLTDVDWQNLGKVSEIKNQGSCNAGYVFSTTSLIESSLMMQNQNFLLSEQQIIDCAGAEYQSFGCNGGSRGGAIKFAQQRGLSTQKLYPYTGIMAQCALKNGTFKPDFQLLQSNGCDQIKSNLYQSPITVAVNAKTWQLYNNGVYNNCPTTGQVNHQIFLVGVTVTYWRLKNSWGSRWGQNGYIRVKLGNNCGICQRPGYGFIL